MKVTIDFEKGELEGVLSQLRRIQVTTKEEIESILSENLVAALNSSFLRVALIKKEREKSKK